MQPLEYAEFIMSVIGKKYSIDCKEITFAAQIIPVPAPRMTASDRWKKRPCVVRYMNFKTALRNIAAAYGIKSLPETLNIVFVMPLPKSISKKEREARRHNFHKQRPDRDNMLKSVQDAFDGDDSHCADGRTTKVWGDIPFIIFYK